MGGGSGMHEQISQRRAKALQDVDTMPGDLRACVHEFGYAIVQACLNAGVRDPRHIRHLVREIWDGARQPAQRIGCRKRPKVFDHLDWLLVQKGASVNSECLLRFLAEHSLLVVPLEPTPMMVDASLEEVSGYNVRCSKREKHQRRLRAALQASRKHLFAKLDDAA